ncbi:maintenance of mitochondrial structure and function-domain-containing protein [Thamnocephalis sphaerospora]|uniref:Maintenance of mitochondrial structure and function-domain-containing protein n=1 Tax=Thamnocephalis sphaerospora TaxID=78915 RepID=A0A4P9XWH7_9FUNG|nr:maintenance of mitochondrial structure and function-domain-containing protein [Thamnocephalis sphaerospora]|eukprot:RKP10676.1 maintenance of mitochondrial structure and function-domain-containing protein [Thamnocephalis sphaerospora]
MPAAQTTIPDKIVVHPVVLLSAVDHYNRVAKNTKKRVVGVLLGQWHGKTVNVCNSFAVPFEENERDPSVWFLDHDYVESMMTMFKKVNAKEVMIGWYHSGPKLRGADLAINELLKRYTPTPVLVVIDVQPSTVGLPTDAYFAVEEIHDDGTATTRTFSHIPSSIEAEEAEEIGVEHLLRDIKDDAAASTLTTRLNNQLDSLRGLRGRIVLIREYLAKVVAGKLPVNHQIICNLQDIFNLLPDVSSPETVKAFSVQTNDQLLVIYLASLVRAVIALHNLIDNKLENQDAERAEKIGTKAEKSEAEAGAEDASNANDGASAETKDK